MKKVLLAVLSMVLVAAISIGGTVAYLQDDDSDVNVMTLGNVSIEQHEYEREVDADGNYVTYIETKRDGAPTGYKLALFTQAKPLYPAVGTATKYDEETGVYFAQLDGNPMGMQKPLDEDYIKNVQDKFVFVENTGKTDAYVRTIIAFEIGTAENVMGDPNNANENLIMMNYNQYWKRTFIGAAEIDGNNYYIVEFVYDGVGDSSNANGKHPDGIVHPGEFTYCNLAQVYMTPKATNEDVEKIDGNKNGTYDIIVLSQAVQAAGFADAKTALDTAFGTSAENAAGWFKGVWEEAHAIKYTPAATEDELKAVLEESKNPILTADISVTASPVLVGAGATLNGDGKTIYSPSVAINVAGGTILNVDMVGTDVVPARGGIGSVQYAQTTLVEDITVENVNITGFANAIDLDAAGHTVYVKDSLLENDINIAYADQVIFENCHFTALNNMFKQSGNICLYSNMKFINCHFEENVNFYLDMNCGDYYGTLEFENCTYGNNGVEDRPFETSVGFFTWWMNSQTYPTFNDGNFARTNFTCIVDGTVVWSAN